MSTDNPITRRRKQACKAYCTQLYNFYQGWSLFESLAEIDPSIHLPTPEEMQDSPELYDDDCADGGIDALIFRYFLLHQAERDERAGGVVHDEPIDRLIEAFLAWMEPIWGQRRPPW
jgi:hypothetical protein